LGTCIGAVLQAASSIAAQTVARSTPLMAQVFFILRSTVIYVS
jgi:hypothetical protein